MIRIQEAVEVEATQADAFAFVTRIEDYPAWLPGFVRAEPVVPAADGAALAPGAELRLVSLGPGGVEIASTGRVESVDPPRSIAVSASSGFFGLVATCTVEPLDAARSRIGVAAEIEPRGLAKLAAGRIETELRAAVPDTLARLRKAVEAHAARIPDPRYPAQP